LIEKGNKVNFKNLFKNRFCFSDIQSPTYYNLSKYLQEKGWNSTSYKWLANLSDKNFEFDVRAAQHLEFKHLLAELVKEYCPEVMPETYNINDDNWSTVLNELADKYYYENNQLIDQVKDVVWILKPSLLNNGKNIKIFSKLSQIQRYITNPHLLNGHKYSMRLFVILTNYAGAYIYPMGYFNKSLQVYSPTEFSNLSANITNEHLNEDEANVIQIPSQQIDFFPALYDQIKTIVTNIITGLKNKYSNSFICKNRRELAIFGFDFMVDSDMRVWLLEANHGPCFPMTEEHPLQKILYYDFWQSFIVSFITPISQQLPAEKITYQTFEGLG
jgi:hypothetical protein